jgi:hypothetical protein
VRYAEKSFEVRFCAALTAAIMPMNRNPKWFGLTQAEERKAGIDTVLGIGGRLVIFQFKAKQKGKIKIEGEQYENLEKIEAKYPNSTYYVFPEAEDIFVAGKENCLFSHAWCCPPSRFSSSFSTGQQSASFSLDTASSKLESQRLDKGLTVERTCDQFGCFCLMSAHDIIEAYEGKSGSLLRFLIRGWQGAGFDLALPPFGDRGIGIPVSRDPSSVDGDVEPLTSEEQFERLLGESANQNLGKGAYGLFIAD